MLQFGLYISVGIVDNVELLTQLIRIHNELLNDSQLCFLISPRLFPCQLDQNALLKINVEMEPQNYLQKMLFSSNCGIDKSVKDEKHKIA